MIAFKDSDQPMLILTQGLFILLVHVSGLMVIDYFPLPHFKTEST